MARKKIPEDKKKPKIGITIDKMLDQILNEHLEELGINRSKYIENLIRKDLLSKRKNIEKDF